MDTATHTNMSTWKENLLQKYSRNVCFNWKNVSNILYCSCWSSCTQLGHHTRMHLHHWWYSHPPDLVSPSKHTWPQLLQLLSPMVHPYNPTSLHTKRQRAKIKKKKKNLIDCLINWKRLEKQLTYLSQHSIKAPSAGVSGRFCSRSLFESSISCFCPLVHGFCFKLWGFSLHHKDQLHSHESEGWHPEK